MKQTWKRIGSLFLSVCMVVTMLPVTAFAETGTKDSGTGLGASGEITAFAALDEDIAAQTAETGTAKDDLNLPKKLKVTVTKTVTTTTGSAVTATVSGNDTATGSEAQKQEQQEETKEITEETTVDVSDWTSAPAYDGNTEGDYLFTPTLALPEDVTLAAGVELPTLTVTVGEKPAVLPQALGAVRTSGEGDADWTLADGLLTIASDTGMYGWRAVADWAAEDSMLIRSSVTDLIIGEAVTSIPINAFNGCNHLASVTFAGTPAVTTIDGTAFAQCTALTAFAVPASVISISYDAFANAPITAFTVETGNATFGASSEGALLADSGATLYIFPLGKTGNYTVESGIITIGKWAFLGTRLSTVVIPAAMGTIGDKAFIDNALTAMIFEGDTPPTIGTDIFLYSENPASIYVPAGKVDTYKAATGLTGYADRIKATIGENPVVTDEAGLKAALEYAFPATITVSDSIELNSDSVTMGANHTLTIDSGKTLTISGNQYIDTNGKALTINGGTVNISNATQNGIRGGGTLNLANVTVNLSNTGNNGGLSNMDITVENGATVNLNSSTAGSQIQLYPGQSLTIDGGTVNVNAFLGSGIYNGRGTIHINGGTLHVDAGSGEDWGITNTSGGLLKLTSGTLSGDSGSAIYLGVGSKVEGMANKFDDRGTEFTASGQVTVGASIAPASPDGLTEGTYYWNGTQFKRDGINVTTEPQDATVTQSTISGFLSAEGAASNGNPVGYQWMQRHATEWSVSYVPIAGATGSSFSIPTNLTAGTYIFRCQLTAANCEDGYTRDVTVTVTPPGGVTPTFASISGVIKGNDINIGISGATVRLKNTSGVQSTTTTDANGQYSFSNLPAATYLIEASAAGYKSGTLSDVVLGTSDISGKDITLTKTSGGSGDDSGGGGNGGGSSSGSTTTPATTTPGKTPNQPVTAAAPVTATAGQNGAASASIPEKSVTDAIAKAQADAKAQGKTANGTTVALNVTMPKGATSLTANLTRNSLNSLVSAGVTSLELNGSPVTVSFDTKALAEIQKQSSGNISITIVPNAKLSASAKAMIGTRPVYDLTVSYQKDGKNATVSSFGGGTATVSVPYTPAKGEAIGGLYAVYVDAKGNATRIAGSAYDANSGCVMFTTTHFSLYGIGYTAPSAKFTDIKTHWAKESIDYVVGRGLLSGTKETTFAPDIAMTRGMLVTALGRLAGVDVKTYTTSSFTDVTLGSAFQPYIEWAYKKGIVQGTGNGKFEPDRAITREEIAVIFTNFAKATGYILPVTRTATTYADASSIGSTYQTAVTAMQQAGIMMGGTSNKFNPKSSATRAEVSSMLHRYIKLTIDPATAQGWALNDAGQYLYYKDGKALTGTQTIDSVKYFFNTDGTLKTGWVKDDAGNWRFYSGNTMLVGFWDLGANGNNKTYYFAKDGSMVAGKWMEIDGKWYYFNADGSLAKNTKIDEYEVDENGVRKTK